MSRAEQAAHAKVQFQIVFCYKNLKELGCDTKESETLRGMVTKIIREMERLSRFFLFLMYVMKSSNAAMVSQL